MVEVKFRSMVHGVRAPEYAHPCDSGADLRWYEEHEKAACLWPGDTRVLWTGIAIELPPGWEAQIRPRSSLSCKGIICHFGTIDNGYRGQLGVALTNTTRERYIVQRGDKIAQLVIAPLVRAQFTEVEQLSETSRSENGFGSTGR